MMRSSIAYLYEPVLSMVREPEAGIRVERHLKTTERYLHVSTEALRRLRSPLDNLDLDG